MANTYRYFISLTPFRILDNSHSKALLISDKGDYVKVNSEILSDFKQGDYIFKSRMVGRGHVNIGYIKQDKNKSDESFSKTKLENLITLFSNN